MIEIFISIFLLLGSFFTLIAALGVIRLPDVYMRMHAITKASSLATIFFLIALMIAHPTARIVLGSVLLLLFIVLTAPISSHFLARVAHLMQVKMAKGKKCDDLKLHDDDHDSGND